MSAHTMQLRPEPFEKIKRGSKTIELRLYDEKRQRISLGDTIRFTNTECPTDTICVEVKEMFVFDSFAELYRALPLTACGYSDLELSTASPNDMAQYYSEEEQKRYGVVGIQISRIQEPRGRE